MKQITALLLTVLTSSLVFAANARSLEYNFTCKSEPVNGKNIIEVSLKNLTSGTVYEMEKHPFQITIKTLQPKTGAVIGKPLVYRGLLETEDVHLQFESTNKEVFYSMYLDELNESSIKFKGQKRIQVLCEEHRW